MKIQYIILFWILSGTSLIGQTESNSTLQIGYYGDVIFHPGIKASYLKPISAWTKERRNKTKYKALLVGADLAYYYNANHHHGLIVGPNFSYRRVKENGKFIQWSMMIGLHRSIIDGSTYEVIPGENFNKLTLAGQSSFYNSLSFLFGKKLSDTIGYYTELGLNGRTPYNNSYLTGIHVGLGIQYSLNK